MENSKINSSKEKLNPKEIGKKIQKLKEKNYSNIYKEKNWYNIKINGKCTVGAIEKKNDEKLLILDYLLSNNKNSFLIKDNIRYLKKKQNQNQKKENVKEQMKKYKKNIVIILKIFININFGKDKNKKTKKNIFKIIFPIDYLIK